MQKTQTTKPKRFKLEIKALGEYIPTRKAKRGSIGYDLAVPADVHIPAHSRTVVKLNFAINLPVNYEAKIEPRSGFSSRGIEGYGTKYIRKKIFGIFTRKTVVSGKMNFDADVIPGKVDPNYTDSVGVIIRNNDEAFTIRKGTRIAQMTIYRTTPVWFVPVEELTCESRGGGFGSSGSSTTEPTETKADEESSR